MRTISLRRLTPVVLALALGSAGAAVAFPLPPLHVETVALFDVSHFETPESLVFDHSGNMFVSLALAGEIRKIAPNGTQTVFAQLPIGPPLTFCGGFFNGVTGLEIDHQGTVYASLMRLVQKQWVSAQWGVSDNNRKAKFYTITRPGRRRLAAEADEWRKVSGVISRLLQLAAVS